MFFLNCKKEKNEEIIETQNITADFSANKKVISEKDTVVFSDISSGNPSSWEWTFKGGTPNTSSEKNPIVIYNTAGSFNVTLKSSNDLSSDILTKENFIIVEETIEIGFELIWQTSVGELFQSEDVRSFIETSDCGYISVGRVYTNTEEHDLWIVKFTSDLDVLWEKTYGGSDHEFGSTIIETIDGNYVINGWTNSSDGNITNNHGGYDLWVLKINQNGEIIWQKTYGGSGSESCGVNSIIETNDGGFLTVANSESTDGDVSTNNGGCDVWLLKLDTDGAIEWEKSFGGDQNEYGDQIFEDNGGFILGLKSNSYNGDFPIPGSWVTKITNSGELLWISNLGGMNYGKTIKINDGGFLTIIGNDENSSDLEVVKLDENGNKIWVTSFGGSKQEFGSDIIQLEDNSFIILGMSMSNDGEIGHNYGQKDLIIAKLSETGGLLAIKNIGGSENEYSYSIIKINQGEFLINAVTASNDHDVIEHNGILDNWLIIVKEIIE